MSPSLTIGKVFLLSTRKLLETNLSWARGFGIEFFFLSRSSKVTMFFWNVFGLAFRKLFNPFRHDLGFSADAHRHQVPFGLLSLKQVGLWFYAPLEGLDQHHLSLGCELSTTPSPSIPPSAPTASGENLLIPFMIFYVFLCLLCRSYGAKRPEIYKTSTTCFSSLMRGLGRHMWGEISSSSWGKETSMLA